MDSSGFDFSRFDVNGDYVIDVTAVLHSGYAAEYGGSDCNTGATSLDRIQSFASSATYNTWVSTSGYSLGNFFITSGLEGLCNFVPAKVGTMIHEFLHTFGLPDLYDKRGKYNNNPSSVGGIAGYDVM